jgi:Zn-dependent protease
MLTDLSGFDITVVLVSLLVSMVIHEAMHGYVAHWLGDTTASEMGRLTLNPLKHIDLLTTVLLPMVLILSGLPPLFAAKPVPFNPEMVKYEEFGVALVGVAGPLTNLALAAIAGLVFRGADLSLTADRIIVIFTQVNVGFFIFNMIPFPPLDGSRLLYAFAPEPLQNIMRQIESLGFVAIIVFFFVVFQFVITPVANISDSLVRFLLNLPGIT